MDHFSDTVDLSGQVLAEHTRLVLPSRPDWIEPAVEFLRQKAVLCGACQESRAGKLMIALHEALSNAVVHGNLELSSELKERGDESFAEALAERAADPVRSARTVEVRVDYDGRLCRWTILDQGQGFDVERVMTRVTSDDPEVLLASGRGILIMRSFMDEVRYELGGRRLVLVLARANGAEKRCEVRQPAQEPIQVVPVRPDGAIDWAAAYQALSRDFSAQGMGLLQGQLHKLDRVVLGITRDNQVLYIPAQVRHCQAIGSDMVELGCQFVTETGQDASPVLSDTDTQAVQRAIAEVLGRQQEPVAVANERRQHPRVSFHQRIQILTAASSEPLVGFTRDLSKGGVAFISTHALAGEIIIQFAPLKSQPIQVKSTVVRCHKIEEGFYDVGARFVSLEE